MNGFNSALDTVNTKIGEWNEGFFYILPNLIVALGVALISWPWRSRCRIWCAR
jgi:hypothetical protein